MLKKYLIRCDIHGEVHAVCYCPKCVGQRLEPPTPSALDTQVGGGHYKDMPIQPIEFIHKNGISFIEGSVIKYVARWRKKNGVEDLRKARHFLDLLIEMEESKP